MTSLNHRRPRELVRLRQLCDSGAAKQIRLDRGLSLWEIAESIPASPASIHRWENATARAHGSRAERYLKVLDDLRRSEAVA